MIETTTHLVEEVARESRGRLLAILSRRTGDLAAAEDALQRAFLKALERWPDKGAPERPEAWLLTTAKNFIIDGIRSSKVASDAQPEILQAVEELSDDAETRELPERRLELLFACAHPAIDETLHAPLMLNVVLGATAAQIANCWVTSPDAMAQRLVRAKAKIKKAGVPFDIPPPEERLSRSSAVLNAVYAALTLGGADGELAEEAGYLAALVSRLLPNHAEAAGLRALTLQMLAVRSKATEHFVPLSKRNSEEWDSQALDLADDILARTARRGEPGRFQIESAINSAHIAMARDGTDTREAVVFLYERLLECAPTMGAYCGYAAALLEADQRDLASKVLIQVAPNADEYQPYWVVRAELSSVLGSADEARRAWQRAAELTSNPQHQEFLLNKTR